jgi:hypothetical protein
MYGNVHTTYSPRCILICLPDVAKECRAKAAVLFSVPMTMSSGDCWRWRSVDEKTDSTQSFIYRYDCLENAQANGYRVEATPRRADTAPTMRSSQAMEAVMHGGDRLCSN